MLPRRVDALAEKMLLELFNQTIDATRTTDNGSDELSQVNRELYDMAMVCQQQTWTINQAQLPENILFLCEYAKLHQKLAQLQQQKSSMQSAKDEQALPELQERIEHGVDEAAAWLMHLFDGPTDYWGLLLLAVEELCGICTPAFDRDEVRR